MARRGTIRLLIAVLLLAVAGCGANAGKGKETGIAMEKWHIEPECDFAAFDATLMDETPCSPVIDDPDFEGIVLNAPESVAYTPGDPPVPGSDAFADVRVCGTACVDQAYRGLHGRVHEEILLVAVDSATQQTYSGKMEPIVNPEERPADLGGGPVDTEGLLVESYFNPNLAEVLELPERPAEYLVYAVLGEMKSNTVRIRVERRD